MNFFDFHQRRLVPLKERFCKTLQLLWDVSSTQIWNEVTRTHILTFALPAVSTFDVHCEKSSINIQQSVVKHYYQIFSAYWIILMFPLSVKLLHGLQDFIMCMWSLCVRLHLEFSVALRTQMPFIRTIRDREPRTSTSTFMQLLSSVIYIYTWRNLGL